MSRTSVLVVTSTYPRSPDDEGPRFIHELCRRLILMGLDVDVVAPSGPGAAKSETIDGVDVFRFRYFIRRWETLAYDGGIVPKLKQNPLRWLLVPFFLCGLTAAIRARLGHKSYDVVHAHWIIPQGICAAIACSGRSRPTLVHTVHGSDLLGLRPLRFLKRMALRRGRHTTVVSAHLRQVLLEELDGDDTSITVAPMGIDLDERFTLRPDVSRRANSVLFVGRLAEEKGCRYLLEAVALVRRRRIDVEVTIVGDGPLRANLVDRAHELDLDGHVSFVGTMRSDRLPELYAGAAITVVPSTSEGFGLTIVEAMGCGCPVVASDLPAIREIVVHGQTGLLATPADAESLAHGMESLLLDKKLADSLARSARQSVLERFGWHQAASRYAALLTHPD